MDRNVKIVILILAIFSINFGSISAQSDFQVFNWSTGGDVTNNTEFNSKIPHSDIVDEIVEGAKRGTPMLRFGNGSGHSVLICAGVHGNELSSQIAALTLINEIKSLKSEINGTIYIIPMAIPLDTALNQREFNGTDPNRDADVNGTVTNNVFKLSQNFSVIALGDFHTTYLPINLEDDDEILVTYPKTGYQNNLIYVYTMHKLINTPLIEYPMDTPQNPGVLQAHANFNGIPSFTYETKTRFGYVDGNSAERSLLGMKAFLTATGIYDFFNTDSSLINDSSLVNNNIFDDKLINVGLEECG